MNKKKFNIEKIVNCAKKLFFFSFVTILTFSCTKDDDFDGSSHDPALIGKWNGTIEDSYYYSDTFEFGKNGKFTWTNVYGDSKYDSTEIQYVGEWSTDGHNLLVVFDKVNVISLGSYLDVEQVLEQEAWDLHVRHKWTYNIVDNILYLNFDGMGIPGPPSTDENLGYVKLK